MCGSEKPIPVEIDSEEILVRFVFYSNFRNRSLMFEVLKTQDVYYDSRGNTVSLQRGRYADEQACKKLAKAIPSKGREYVGFLVFKKADFDDVVRKYQEERAGFIAEIRYSPLNADREYLEKKDSVLVTDPGSPAHADIVYVEPAITWDETPKIPIRQFSYRLANCSRLLIDQLLDDELSYGGEKFK